MLNNALYYPYIAFNDSAWLKAMAMYYENIYRIVPDNIIPDDPEDLRPLLEDSSIGAMIDPVPYTAGMADIFIEKTRDWSAAAISSTSEGEREFSRLHTDKTDQKVKELFASLGYKETDNWLNIPTELASNYMLFLATEIGRRNQLSLITSEWAPWTATTYFSINGGVDEFIMPYGEGENFIKDPFALFCLILGEITPLNISDIPGEKICDFRVKRRDEIASFRTAVAELYNELQKLEDPKVRYDFINTKIDQLKKAKAEYQRSADIIKAKGWFGVSFMGFPAPVTLGALFNIPAASTVALALSGIAIGGLFYIKNAKAELRKLQKENPVSCLVEMRRSFKKYTSFRGVGDMNYHAFNCMEEYVND